MYLCGRWTANLGCEHKYRLPHEVGVEEVTTDAVQQLTTGGSAVLKFHITGAMKFKGRPARIEVQVNCILD